MARPKYGVARRRASDGSSAGSAAAYFASGAASSAAAARPLHQPGTTCLNVLGCIARFPSIQHYTAVEAGHVDASD